MTFPKPLDSARLFKHLSDEVLKHGVHPTPSVGAVFIPVNDAGRETADLGKELAVLGKNRDPLTLTGMWGQKRTITPEELAQPIHSARVWVARNDNAMNAAAVEINGEPRFVKYIGSTEWYRYLEVSLSMPVGDDDLLSVKYSMQRVQHEQNEPATLSRDYYLNSHFETGYEGSDYDGSDDHLIQMSEKEELRFLSIVAALAGVGLRNTPFEAILGRAEIPVLDPVTGKGVEGVQ